MTRPSRNQRDHHISHLGCCVYDSCRKTFIVCNAAGLKGWILSSLYQYTVGLPGRAPIHRNTYSFSKFRQQTIKQTEQRLHECTTFSSTSIVYGHDLAGEGECLLLVLLVSRISNCSTHRSSEEIGQRYLHVLIRSWRFPQRPMGEACR